MTRPALIPTDTATDTTARPPATKRILHLGCGAFHRAHQAWYLHDLQKRAIPGAGEWSLSVGNIRDDGNAILDALTQQQGRYTLETVDVDGQRRYETITAISDVIAWTPSLSGLIATGADAATRIISFTVTEAGYYLDDHRQLLSQHADIRHDLDGGHRTIYGTIAAILRERQRRGTGKVTLQCCDNVRSNGARFRDGMLAFLRASHDTGLIQWIGENTRMPNAMVDRIVPRPGPDVTERVLAAGFTDRVPVMGEQFIQWVIEDDFAAGRPPWEQSGVQMVSDVSPYEEAKIRILNAAHSGFAWTGTLAGDQFIHEAASRPALQAMMRAYITDDVLPVLSAVPESSPQPAAPVDLPAYRDIVLKRFCNAALRDTLQRVAADGFAKVPGFLLPTLRDRLEAGQSIAATMMLIAAFWRFLERWHQQDLPWDYQDSALDPAVVKSIFTAPDPLVPFLNNATLWGKLAGDKRIDSALRLAIPRLNALSDTLDTRSASDPHA